MPYKDEEKRKAYAKEHYRKNKNVYKTRARKHSNENRAKLRNWIWDYLSGHPCVDCGENDPIVLQFDHLRDKKYAIANSVTRSISLETLKEEVEKCEVRCANCHQRKTAAEQGWWADKTGVGE